MTAITNNATTADNSDAVLDGLLNDLNDGNSGENLDQVLKAGVIAGVPGAVDLLQDLGGLDALDGLDDNNLETIEGADTGAISATSVEGGNADPLDEIIEGAAANEKAEPTVAPVKAKGTTKKGGAKKGKKAATSVPAGYSDYTEEPKTDAKTTVEKEDENENAAKAAAAGEPAGEPDAPTAAPTPAKAPRATSVTHRPGDLLLIKLGAEAPNLLVFDDRHDGEQINQKLIDFVAKMNVTNSQHEGYIADKVKDKMQMFLCWLAKGGELNEVLKRTITLLHKDGKLVSGDKGNLHLNLLSKPYSPGTARSQGNQMFMALPELGMVIKGKGTMEPNPHSPLLQMAFGALGLK